MLFTFLQLLVIGNGDWTFGLANSQSYLWNHEWSYLIDFIHRNGYDHLCNTCADDQFTIMRDSVINNERGGGGGGTRSYVNDYRGRVR